MATVSVDAHRYAELREDRVDLRHGIHNGAPNFASLFGCLSAQTAARDEQKRVGVDEASDHDWRVLPRRVPIVFVLPIVPLRTDEPLHPFVVTDEMVLDEVRALKLNQELKRTDRRMLGEKKFALPFVCRHLADDSLSRGRQSGGVDQIPVGDFLAHDHAHL